MRFKIGDHRVVFIYGAVAIKFPRIEVAVVRETLRLILTKRRRIRYIRWLFGSLYSSLYKGMSENWQEFCFYSYFNFPLLQPTYFSLGLINIQRSARKYEVEGERFVDELDEITNGAIEGAHHTFGNIENFGMWRDKLRILDYGDHRAQAILLEYADKIFMHFNKSA